MFIKRKDNRNYLMQLREKTVYFYDISIFIKIINFRFYLETFSNLHCFILTNFILNTANGQIIKSVATRIEIMKLNYRQLWKEFQRDRRKIYIQRWIITQYQKRLWEGVWIYYILWQGLQNNQNLHYDSYAK